MGAEHRRSACQAGAPRRGAAGDDRDAGRSDRGARSGERRASSSPRREFVELEQAAVERFACGSRSADQGRPERKGSRRSAWPQGPQADVPPGLAGSVDDSLFSTGVSAVRRCASQATRSGCAAASGRGHPDDPAGRGRLLAAPRDVLVRRDDVWRAADGRPAWDDRCWR